MIAALDLDIVLCHGWGFTPAYWDPLVSWLDGKLPVRDCIRWNLGYAGPEECKPPSPQTVSIAIGHSLGLAPLLRAPYTFDAYIGLNTFPVFCEQPDYPFGHHIAELESLKRHLQKAPELTLRRFYERCGLKSIPLSLDALNLQKLYDDLDQLITLDLRQLYRQHLDTLMLLHTSNDPVVPLSQIMPALTTWPPHTLSVIEGDHHVLGLLECARIGEFIISVYQNILNLNEKQSKNVL